jgi:hypothetical protein
MVNHNGIQNISHQGSLRRRSRSRSKGLSLQERDRRQAKGIVHISINSHNIPSHARQIFRTVLDHLTTTIFQISMYLTQNKTPRDTITKFTWFRPLTEKKILEASKARLVQSLPTNVVLRPDAQDFLTAVGWSQNTFVEAYNHVFDAMASQLDIDTHHRFSKDLVVRLFSMTALTWTSDSKNRNHDWDKVAIALVVEAALIELYREKLLNGCPLARALRKEFHDFFFGMTHAWRQMDRSERTMTLVTDKKWIFPDNIYVDDEIHDATPSEHHIALRSQFQVLVSKKSAPKKKKSKKKDAPSPQTLPATTATAPEAPDQGTTPAHKDSPAPTTAAAKDNPQHKKSDDIQSLLSSLKSIQKHKLLQCSDKDSPSGSTESIVSFAASIIGHVCIRPLFHDRHPSLTIVPQVAYMNKARIEHEVQNPRSKKGKGKEAAFDMSSVTVPDLNLLAHSISSEHRDNARISLCRFRGI